MITGTGIIRAEPSPGGEYILRVDGLEDGSTFSVDVSRNGEAGRAVDLADPTMVEMIRPEFIDPVISVPELIRSAVTLTKAMTISVVAPIALVVALFIATLSAVVRERQLHHSQ